MTLTSKSLVSFALCVLLGAASAISAQTTTVTRKRIPQDPADAALNGILATAQAAMEQKDYDRAAKSYQQYLEEKPDDAAVHFELGYAYSALERFAEAKSEYEKAISLDPKMSEAYLNLGLTLMDSDPGEAVPPLEKATALEPNQARPKFLLGEAFERSGKLAPAIEQYEAAKKIDEKDADVRFALGRALLTSGHAGEAETEFRAAIAISPISPLAHLGLARSLLVQKKMEAALPELSEYLEAQPKDIVARLELASALVDAGKNDEALVQLDRAANAGPESLKGLLLRSEIYFFTKRYDEAVPVLQKAEGLAPDNPNIPARLGHIYLEKKDYPDAATQLIASLKLDPGANDVLGDLVAAQYLSKNYRAALESLSLLAKRKDLPAGTWFIRAECYDRLGESTEALEDYQKFLQLNQDQNSDMYFAASARVRTLTRELKDKKR
jgi:protein O-GlcNAc transferase